jgi:predicted AlkP superfamily pyrophosphatase or phosphodiesterase
MILSRREVLSALATSLVAAGCGQRSSPSSSPILILISIDGWRWDYLDRYEAPSVKALADSGVRGDGLIPQFPSKTFPNHYTLVTGLRPVNHGIVSNNMRDPAIPGEFSLSNRTVQKDPRWWGGEPIWNTAERQGRLAAPMFWPGSEARINGRQATYWIPFDNALPHRDRVARILGWLQQPEPQRPSFLTLYYSAVDSAGHRHGPESNEVREAIADVDRSLAALVDGVAEAGLADRVNYVLVSDHGMAALTMERTIVLDDLIDLDSVDVIDWAPVLGVSPRDGDAARLFAKLKDAHPRMAVYRNGDVPAEYGLAGHPRLADVIGIADEGWNITSKRNLERWEHGDGSPGGTHGYDGRLKSMHGLFVASGPRFKRGMVAEPFENIHVYELMCAVLGITPARNDGDPAVTRDMLR